MEGPVFIAGDQAVHRQGVDGLGEGGGGGVGEGPALELQAPLTGQLLRGRLGPGAAAVPHRQAGGGGKGLQQLSEGGAVVYVPGLPVVQIEGVSGQLQLQGAVRDAGDAGPQEAGGGFGVLLGDQQGGEDPHGVVGDAVGGVEAVGRDLQAVAVKLVWGVFLGQDQLGHPLAIGPLAHRDAEAMVPGGGSEHLRAAGAPGAGEDHHRHVGVVGGVRADAPVVGQAVGAEHIDHDAVRELSGSKVDGRVRAAGVGAQVHDPDVRPALQLLQGLLHGGGGGGAEAVALDVAHIPVLQLIGDDGDNYGPALQGEVPGLAGAVEPDGEGGLCAGLAPDEGGGVHARLQGDAVHRQDAVSGGQAGLLGGGAVQHREDLHPVAYGGLDGHPDAHHRLAVHLVQEGLVLLGGHIGGIGVVQGVQNSLNCVLLQDVFRDLVHIIGLE